MAYERKEISIENIRAQEAVCARIREILTDGGGQPLAMVDTYGCQQNEADSEKLRGYLAEMGCAFTQDEFSADIIVVNTCAVREHAEMRVLGNVGQLNHSKKAKPGQIIAVCGCMVQQEHMAEKIKRSYPVVDLVFGPHDLWHFPELLLRVMTGKKRVFATERCDGYVTEGMPLKRDGKVKAWLSVMYGCNNFCTYCIVPYVRGRERSRSAENIIAEIREVAAEGYKEIMLLGQNVNSYGNDIEGGTSFAELLHMACRVDGIERVRFMTSHPKDISDGLIDAIAAEDKICKQLHLPVQCGSDRILKKMNRKYTRAEYLEKVRRVRARIPDIVLSTDIIVGFPGETNEDFEQTMSLLAEVEYDLVFSFIYSKRKGTPAAEMEDCLTDKEKHENFERMLRLQDEISRKKNDRYVGRTEHVLVESVSRTNSEFMSGRTDGGKIVNFRGDESMVGKILDVKITEAKTWSLLGEIADRL